MDVSMRELLDAEMTVKAHAAALNSIENRIARAQLAVRTHLRISSSPTDSCSYSLILSMDLRLLLPSIN